MSERCDPPHCIRLLGHPGKCGRSIRANPQCGKLMRNLQEPCARRLGHAGGHKSRYALDNDRDAQWFGVRW